MRRAVAIASVASLVAIATTLPTAPAAARPKKTTDNSMLWVAGERFPTPAADAPRVLLIGDSNFFGPLGHVLARAYMQRGYVVRIRGKSASGLANPEYFDWFAEARRLVDEVKPDIVITMIGANDVQRISWPVFGDRIQFKNEPVWRRAYYGRFREFARMLAERVPEVVMLSPTNRGWPKAVTAVTKVREVQQRAVVGFGNVHWIDMFPYSSNADGSWLHEGVEDDGHGGRRHVSYRTGDRIHLTAEGGRYVGSRLLAAITERGLDPRHVIH